MVSITVDVSNIVDGLTIDSADVTLPLGQLQGALENTLNGVQPFDQLSLGTATEVTISGGSITINHSHHRVDTEANAPSDELDSILGSSEGDVLYLRLEDAGRVVIVKHGTGNIQLPGNADFALNNANKTLKLFYNGSNWTAISGTSGTTVIVPRTELTVDVASITINSIPQDYSHLKLFYEIGTDFVGTGEAAQIRFNGDSGFNYHWTNFWWRNTNLTTFYYGDNSLKVRAGSVGATGLIAAGELTIFSYKKIGDVRRIQNTGVYLQTGASELDYSAGGGEWTNTIDPIASITLSPHVGTNLKAGGSYMLLGVG